MVQEFLASGFMAQRLYDVVKIRRLPLRVHGALGFRAWVGFTVQGFGIEGLVAGFSLKIGLHRSM